MDFLQSFSSSSSFLFCFRISDDSSLCIEFTLPSFPHSSCIPPFFTPLYTLERKLTLTPYNTTSSVKCPLTWKTTTKLLVKLQRYHSPYFTLSLEKNAVVFPIMISFHDIYFDVLYFQRRIVTSVMLPAPDPLCIEDANMLDEYYHVVVINSMHDRCKCNKYMYIFQENHLIINSILCVFLMFYILTIHKLRDTYKVCVPLKLSEL